MGKLLLRVEQNVKTGLYPEADELEMIACETTEFLKRLGYRAKVEFA